MKNYSMLANLLINELKKYATKEDMDNFINEYKEFEPEWNDIEYYLTKYYSYYFYITLSEGITGVIFERIKGYF